MKVTKALVLLSSLLLSSCGDNSKDKCNFTCELEVLVSNTKYEHKDFSFN